MTKEDLQFFSDDVSAWIVELGLESELDFAAPHLSLPLQLDDVEDGFSCLAYLIVWMCLKSKQRAPAHLESRLMMLKVSGPWVRMYIQFIQGSVNLFELAG
jgi:hypothetical protein